MTKFVDANFQSKLIILIFWAIFEKEYFRSETEKLSASIEFCILKLAYNPGQNI